MTSLTQSTTLQTQLTKSYYRQLGEECEHWLDTAKGEDRVRLLYYQSNTYSAVIASKGHDAANVWDWEQPDGIQNLLLLRRAIGESAFEVIEPTVSCQIRTNLANRLNTLGRPVAANEQWLQVLDTEPRFAKALAARGKSNSLLCENAVTTKVIHPFSWQLQGLCLKAALDVDSLWESGDRDYIAPALFEEHKQIASYLISITHNDSLDLNQWPLGATEEERSYRHWCLRERLFLNPMNDAYTESVAATDVLHLPSHSYKTKEAPRFPAYYNLLKQEYISARYRLFYATHKDDPDFLMRDVLMPRRGVAIKHWDTILKSFEQRFGLLTRYSTRLAYF